jgi:hypothetical protein
VDVVLVPHRVFDLLLLLITLVIHFFVSHFLVFAAFGL